MPQSFVKDPDAILDYYVDWGPWLGGDTLVTSTWSTTSSVVLSQDEILGTLTRIWVSGGVVGEAVELVNHIVTAEGRADDRTVVVIIREL